MKAFIFDLDGTLIMGNRPLDDRLEHALLALHRKGHHIVFATSRACRGVRHVLPRWCLHLPIIFCNGAFATYCHKIVHHRGIQTQHAHTIIQRLETESLPYFVELGAAYYHPCKAHPLFDALAREARYERISFSQLLTYSIIYKIGILEQPTIAHDYLHLLRARNQIELYQHYNGELDVVAAGCSKWTAFCALAAHLKYDEVISFGNDTNDVCLFRHSTHAIAVGNHASTLHADINEYVPAQEVRQLCSVIQKYM